MCKCTHSIIYILFIPLSFYLQIVYSHVSAKNLKHHCLLRYQHFVYKP